MYEFSNNERNYYQQRLEPARKSISESRLQGMTHLNANFLVTTLKVNHAFYSSLTFANQRSKHLPGDCRPGANMPHSFEVS